MKIGYSREKEVFYVAEYDKTEKKVVVRDTSKSFDELAVKHGFVVEDETSDDSGETKS